jgi:methionine-rich copper-binding protein CopC
MSTRHRSAASLGAMILLIGSMLLPAGVLAHAELEATVPADAAAVEGSPIEISATFSEALAIDGSSLTLRDASGGELATGGLDPADQARLLIDPVPELAPGDYEVQWAAATDDGHLERGTWTFSVTAAPTPSSSPAPSPTAAPSATATDAPSPTSTAALSPTVAPSPSPDGGSSAGDTSDVILPIIIALALVAIVGGFLLTRRGRGTPPPA